MTSPVSENPHDSHIKPHAPPRSDTDEGATSYGTPSMEIVKTTTVTSEPTASKISPYPKTARKARLWEIILAW